MSKQLASIAIALILASAGVNAAGGHDGMRHGPGMDEQSHPAHQFGSLPLMDEAEMDAMGAHMEKMRAQMREIQNENNPQKRRALMRQHHQTMRSMMQKMHGKKGKESGRSDNRLTTEERLQRMEQHIKLMRGMMQQMMERQASDQSQ